MTLPCLLPLSQPMEPPIQSPRCRPWAAVCSGFCFLLALWGLGWSAIRIATEGVGVLGVNNAAPWGWDVALFVFWIGLGHAGTLISAVLLLSGKRWRKAIARHAELMTLCSVCTAAIFPLVHVGRVWMLWQVAPVPLPSGVWPNLASALIWDVAAISAYFLLSCLFWLMGILGEGLQDSGEQARWARTCTLMAGILTPLVVTVHSVVGCDFALLLRWHEPLFPPFFVCGALLSGMAAVQLIALCLRTAAVILNKLALLTLGLAGAMGLFYGLELLQHPGLWGYDYALLFLLNVALPALYSFPLLRRSRVATGLVSVGILGGMWAERVHIIIARSLALTGGQYHPSGTDAAMMAGSIGLFFFLFLSLSRRMPPERRDPLDIQPPLPSAPGWWAAGGAALGLLVALLWAVATQDSDTAGILSGRPHGFFYYLPALFVCSLAGAGAALSFQFFLLLKRSHP